MAKRFIDTDLFRKPLMRGLKAPYKALWIYLLCECDHAGIWDVELDVLAVRLGLEVDIEEVLMVFGGAIVQVDEGKKWYIPDFVAFQYGELKPENRVHASVIAHLTKLGIDLDNVSKNKPLTSPLKGAKDKDKDRDFQEKEKERAKTHPLDGDVIDEAPVSVPMDTPQSHEATLWPSFSDFWEAYGKRRGKPLAIQAWAKVSQSDREAIMAALPAYTAANEKQYRLDPVRYLKYRAWEDEVIPRNTLTNGKPTEEQRFAEYGRILAERYPNQ